MSTKMRLSRRKKAILDAIESLAGPFTAQQLWGAIDRANAEVSRATMYRILQRLREERFIKDIILPHGLHVSIRTEANVYCIVECEDCGHFRLCQELAAQLSDPSQALHVTSEHIAIYIRGGCRDRQAEGTCALLNGEEKSAIRPGRAEGGRV